MAGELISRIYSGFRGADFRGEEINLVRSPDCLNVWKDYKETESIRTRPDLKLYASKNNADWFFKGGETIYGLYFYKGELFAHIDNHINKITLDDSGEVSIGLWGDLDNLTGTLNKAKSNGFIYEDAFYFMDGKNYLKYDGNVWERVADDAYIPTTSIARRPSGGGEMHEDVNMLSPYRINTFLADGASKDFYLDTKSIDKDYSPIVKVDDKEVTNYTVDYDKGVIKFDAVVSAPLTDGQDNVSVQFKKTIPKYLNSILNCTMLQVFDNRVFVSGNPDYPNTVWHCSLNNPSYFSDLDYYREGLDEASVKGLVAGNNALWVFREPSDANTTVFYHSPVPDAQYGKVYPSVHSSITTGCVGAAINFNDDIVFFSNRGMEGISGDVTTEQVLGHRSTLVDRKLTAEPDYKNMILAEWDGYLMVFIGNKCYLADSRTAFTNENHIEYEWFYWQFDKTITCAAVNNGILYLGTDDGIYTLTDNTSDVESYWTTPLDKFKYPHKLKTTNKRGCVVEATGDISVYAKLEDTDFELIGEYKNVTDYFVSRIKRKKFKDIQLKFYSKTRFSLETASLECFIGGYIKR